MTEAALVRPPGWRRRPFGLLFIAAGVGVLLVGGRYIPREQHVVVVLGKGAARVVEVRLGYVRDSETLREVAFAYPAGGAPRVVEHALHLRDGDYVVDVEIASTNGRVDLERKVILSSDGTTRIDVADAVL